MKINNEFTVHAPIDRAWALLTDVEAIAPCMPGAQLTGIRPPDTDSAESAGDVYEGKVKVKMGPVMAEYKGTAIFIEKDDEKHRGVIDAKGRDSRGAGNASAVITVQLRTDGEGTTVDIDTDLKISGKIAQFGAGMIQEVSEKLLGQFVGCLEGKLAAPAEPEPAEPVPSKTEGAALTPSDAESDERATSEPVAAEPVAAEPVAANLDAAGPVAGPAVAAPIAAASTTSTADPTTGTGGSALSEGPPEPLPVDAPLPSTIAPATAPPAAAAAAAAATSPAAEPDRPVRRTFQPSPEPEALDLLDLAGGAAFKRLLPLAVAGVAVVAAVIFFLTRR